jgi:hypothetical protein
MAMTNSPVSAWDFRSSLTSVYGTSETLVAIGSTVRNSTGLICNAGGEGAQTSGAPAGALQLTLPFTIGVNYDYVGTVSDSIPNSMIVRLGQGFWWRGLPPSTDNFIVHYSGASYADQGVGSLSYRTVGLRTMLFEVRANGFTIRDGGGVLYDTTAKTWTNTTYGSEPIQVGDTGANLRAVFKHMWMWSGTLDATDRAAILADPLAYVAASSATAAISSGYHNRGLR